MEKTGGIARNPPRMKNRLLLMGCAAALMMTAPVSAQDTPLAEKMDEMDTAYKAFRREQDPAKGAALAREAQDAVLKALPEVPGLIASMPEGTEKAKAMAAYRKMMGMLFVTLCEVEEAFVNNEIDKVAELVQSLKDLKKEGHEQFMEE